MKCFYPSLFEMAFLCAVAAYAAPAAAQARPPRPDFSGKWVLNVAKSDFGSNPVDGSRMPAPKSSVYEIMQDDNRLTLTSTGETSDGHSSSGRLYCPTSGGDCVLSGAYSDPQVHIKVRSSWDGDVLVFDGSATKDAVGFRWRDSYTRSADDEKTVVVRHHIWFGSGAGETEQMWVMENSSPPPRPPMLALSLQPANVQVYVDDAFKGMTSAEGRLVVEGLAPGTHRVRMNLLGYTEAARTVELKAGETATIEARLEPAGPKPLALGEIEEALTNGLPPKGITKLVNQYGVDFTLTKEVEQRLRDKGANSDLLLAIATNKK